MLLLFFYRLDKLAYGAQSFFELYNIHTFEQTYSLVMFNSRGRLPGSMAGHRPTSRVLLNTTLPTNRPTIQYCTGYTGPINVVAAKVLRKCKIV